MPQVTSKLLQQLSTELGIELYLWHIQESEEELLSLLPNRNAIAAEVSNYKSEKRRKEWLATRVLFYRNEAPVAAISYKPSGCPFLLKARHSQISISHSRQYVCILLSYKPASVDIEGFSPKAFLLRDRFARKTELRHPTDIDQEHWATMLWSAKEAVYKLSGKPELRFKDEIILSQTAEGKHLLKAVHPDGIFNYSVRFTFFPNFVLTLCF